MRQRLWSFVKENPIPPFALLGLIAGTVLTFWVHPQHITELITGGSFAFGWQDLDIADWVWLVTLVVGGAPLVWSTLKGMLRGRFASDVVAMLAILTAVVMGEYFAGVIVVLMQSGGEALERYGLRRASSSLEHLLARAPRTARRKQADRLEEIDVAEVAIGDHLVVRPGELIPVDGTLLSPSADVDESAVTGEPLAAGKQRDDRLLSGSVNAGGPFEMDLELQFNVAPGVYGLELAVWDVDTRRDVVAGPGVTVQVEEGALAFSGTSHLLPRARVRPTVTAAGASR